MPETINISPENVYVRQDVFNARMDRLEILIEKNGTELKAYVDNALNGVKGDMQNLRTELKGDVQSLRTELNDFRTEMKGDIQNLRAEVRVLEGHVDNAINVVYWGIGGFAVILAAAVFLPAIIGFLKKIFVPSVTVEDVERIVNAAISRHFTNSAGGRTA